MLRSTAASGRLVGQVGATQSFGSIAGTLVTTFVLVPWIGTRSITLLFGLVVALSALSLFALKWVWDETADSAGSQQSDGTLARDSA